MTNPDPSRPTLSEVARRAGVGRSSAARVLGNYGSVSEHTRRRVLVAAAELGYETNELARSMSTGVTMTIGVVLADIANPFFAAVFRGISDAARAAGYGTLLVNSDEDPELEDEAVRLLVGKQVDGIIAAPAGGAHAPAAALRWAHERGTAVVQVDRTLNGFDADAVVMDNRDAARTAAERLIAAGHRRVALAWGPARQGRGAVTADHLREWAGSSEISSVGERYLGYAAALEAAGIPLDPALVMTGEQTIEGVRRFARRALAGEGRPTAFIATEVDAVIGVLAEARAAGLVLPADLSLIGFDDSPWASVHDPPITTLRQPVQRLGEHAAEILIARLGGDRRPRVVDHLASETVDQGSVAPPG
ncbi:LacI family DNA-binding transcriptional regulator [Leucobacter sp. CSA1]|uniref:LacI family DNA-binding transcriptional regulator n=1 Tax=Leucobacter chromiisoli TaxID=2796471 RepID=A0A934UUQ8_9MICO|nr:LacI family DNA-binding transcriptional regulator [Leucobacter chromiisoli]MBK0418686.1 LacI family DNA-binding transcriptional regulator [Leucobacter chromiisoli]